MEKDNEALIKAALELPSTKRGVAQRLTDYGMWVFLAALGFLGPLLLVGGFFGLNGVIVFIGLTGGALCLHCLVLSADADDRWEALERRLREHLTERGITAEDTSEAAQRERAAFWQQAQTSALLDLRQHHLQRVDTPLAQLNHTLWASRAALTIFSLIWAGATLWAAMVDYRERSGVLLFLAVSVVLYAVIVGVALAVRTLTRSLRSNNARAALQEELRHAGRLIDAAGGLSLATEQPDDLRGALSSDAAQGGELEEVP